MSKSHLEEQFLQLINLQQRLNRTSIPSPEREYRFHHTRRWRFDFAWPSERVAVEIEGGIWAKGRHSRGSGMVADMDKYNEAARLGWRVLRFTDKHLVRHNEVFDQLLDALGVKEQSK